MCRLLSLIQLLSINFSFYIFANTDKNHKNPSINLGFCFRRVASRLSHVPRKYVKQSSHIIEDKGINRVVGQVHFTDLRLLIQKLIIHVFPLKIVFI